MDSKNTLVINIDDLLYEFYKIRQEHWLTLAKQEDLPFNETFFMAYHEANIDKREKIGREYPLLEPYFSRIEALIKTEIDDLLPTIQPKPEKLDILSQLSQDYALVLVSSLNRVQLSALTSLNQLGFENNGLFSTKDVMSGKPDPDIYLRIARALNVKPNKLVIVDSNLNGILASYLANAKGVYISEFMAPNNAIMEFSTIYLDRMDQLKTTLDEWFTNRNG